MVDRYMEIMRRGVADHHLVKAFNRTTILHTKFTEALDELAILVQCALHGVVILVIGATGWGKSALRRKFVADLVKAARSLDLPTARVLTTCLLAPQRPFHWDKDFFNPIIHALNEPCPDYKIDVDSLRKSTLANGPAPSRADRRGYAALAPIDVARNALAERGVIVLAIDDLHVIRRASTGAGVVDNYNVLRSFGDVASPRIVGFATSEMKDMFGHLGQNSRRFRPLMCDPYDWTSEGIAAYVGGFNAMRAICPFKFGFSLDDHINEIKATALSLIGTTHEWMQRTIAYVDVAGDAKSIRWNDMQATALLPEQQAGIRREVDEFRQFVEELRKAEEIDEARRKERENGKKKRGRANPGTRNPIRDPVGCK